MEKHKVRVKFPSVETVGGKSHINLSAMHKRNTKFIQ